MLSDKTKLNTKLKLNQLENIVIELENVILFIIARNLLFFNGKRRVQNETHFPTVGSNQPVKTR